MIPRQRSIRSYVMCPPTYFRVEYAINPWMTTAAVVDRGLAMVQWEALRRIYLDLGHDVQVMTPEPALPDMVFAANGALVIGKRALVASFAHVERQAEADAHRTHLTHRAATMVRRSQHVNEGEGDFMLVGSRVLAGTGFRTTPAAHAELEATFGLPVVSLELVDPRFYHLDVALAVLDHDTVAYYPAAFSDRSRKQLEQLYPHAVIADASDAMAFGLNAVSDGLHVLMSGRAKRLAEQLRRRGFRPIPVNLSELLKAGGGVKCCTMELHRDPRVRPHRTNRPIQTTAQGPKSRQIGTAKVTASTA